MAKAEGGSTSEPPSHPPPPSRPSPAARGPAEPVLRRARGARGTPIRIDFRQRQLRGRVAAQRVGINGFGRIGRNFYRAYLDKDPGLPTLVAVLIIGRADSTHGRLREEVEISGGEISVGGKSFSVLAERDPSALPWADMDVDVVVESTGLFTNREGACCST